MPPTTIHPLYYLALLGNLARLDFLVLKLLPLNHDIHESPERERQS